MTKELCESVNIIEKISTHDKEIILLAPVFFWAKYLRRNINFENFEPATQKIDFDDPLSILKAVFDLQRQSNSDIEGNVVNSVSDILSKHSRRNIFFSHLDDNQIYSICSQLNSMFENQEYCAQCEAWSYYDEESPEDFAIKTAETMLYLTAKKIGLSWYANIDEKKSRQSIMKSVLKENLAKTNHQKPALAAGFSTKIT